MGSRRRGGDAMSYPYRLTVAVPEAMIGNASAMGVCLAAAPHDVWRFIGVGYEDAQGNRYAIASGVVGGGVVSAWQSPMQAPAFAPDVDTDAASAAQAATELTVAPGDPPAAGPSIIAAYLAPNPSSAKAVLTAMGLIEIPVAV